MTVALIVSLSLNLGVAGMLAGQTMHAAQEEAGEERRGRFISRLLERLPEETRATVRKAFGERDEAMGAARARSREATQSIIEALRREPFEPAALEAALAAREAAMAAKLEVRKAQFVTLGEALSDEERALFADELQAMIEARRQRRIAASQATSGATSEATTGATGGGSDGGRE